MASRRQFRRALNRIQETPSVNAVARHGSDRDADVTTGGIGFFEAGNRSVNRQYALKADQVFGGHNLKGGIEYDDVVYSQINQRTGPTFTAPDGRQTATGAQIHRAP
jgi:hypothetical protein